MFGGEWYRLPFQLNLMVHKDIESGALVKVLEADMVSPHPREQAEYYCNTVLSRRIGVFWTLSAIACSSDCRLLFH